MSDTSKNTDQDTSTPAVPQPPSQGSAATPASALPVSGKPNQEQSEARVAGAKVNLVERPAPRSSGVRRAHMTISRIDLWSALKVGFLVAIGISIMTVIAAVIVWQVLDSMKVFASIEELLMSIGSEPLLELMQYLEFSRVVSFSIIVSIVNIVLFTFLSGIFALLYNGISMLVGGLHITITDE